MLTFSRKVLAGARVLVRREVSVAGEFVISFSKYFKSCIISQKTAIRGFLSPEDNHRSLKEYCQTPSRILTYGKA
jgi:hypothetical protein